MTESSFRRRRRFAAAARTSSVLLLYLFIANAAAPAAADDFDASTPSEAAGDGPLRRTQIPSSLRGPSPAVLDDEVHDSSRRRRAGGEEQNGGEREKIRGAAKKYPRRRAEQGKRKKPNVVLILLDDLGYADVGFTGGNLPEVKTPNIDALAKRGVTFTSGYTTGQVCSPTRAGLMLGRHQQGVGIYSAGAGGKGMEVLRYDGGSKTYEEVNPWMTHHLKAGADNEEGEGGYVAGAFGKWHLGLDEVLRAKGGGVYKHAEGGGSDRADTLYDRDTDGDFIVHPRNGPMVDGNGVTPVTRGIPDIYSRFAPLGRDGSPYHPLNRGFDANYVFMGRGGGEYWDPNEFYVSTDVRNPSLGKTVGLDRLLNPGNSKNRGDSSVPEQVWDSNDAPYFIHKDRTPSNYVTNKFTDSAVNFIRDSAAEQDRPFFAYVSYNAPHTPRQAPYHMDPRTGELDRLGNDKRRYAGMSRSDFAKSGIEDKWFDADYDGEWFPDPLFVYETYKDKEGGLDNRNVANCKQSCQKSRVVTQQRAITMAMIRWVDKGVGRIVRALKDPNGDGDESDSVLDDTMIVFLSDNGGASAMRASNKPLNGAKNTIWEGGHRVPFFLTWDRFLKDADGRGTDRRGARIDAPVSSMDIVPTLLDASGACDRMTEATLDGKSLLPLIQDPTADHHEYLFWSREIKSGSYDGAVRRGRWKLIVNNEGTTNPFELYDLESDVGETTDVIGKEPQVAADLKDAYVRFMNDMARRNGERVPNQRLASHFKGKITSDLPDAGPRSATCTSLPDSAETKPTDPKATTISLSDVVSNPTTTSLPESGTTTTITSLLDSDTTATTTSLPDTTITATSLPESDTTTTTTPLPDSGAKSTTTSAAITETPQTSCLDELRPEQSVFADKEPRYICSENRRYRFGMDPDGDLALWSGPNKVWSAGITRGKSGGEKAFLRMSPSGRMANVFSFDAKGTKKRIWSSPRGKDGALLAVTDDGEVQIVTSAGVAAATIAATEPVQKH